MPRKKSSITLPKRSIEKQSSLKLKYSSATDTTVQLPPDLGVSVSDEVKPKDKFGG